MGNGTIRHHHHFNKNHDHMRQDLPKILRKQIKSVENA